MLGFAHLYLAIEQGRARTRRDRLVFSLVNLWICITSPELLWLYKRHLGRIPNVAQPARLSELVQWRKLFDRNPLFQVFSDKLLAKEWARKRCPELAAPRTLWAGRLPREIPDRYLTAGHVIKTNHNSGHNYFPHREALSRTEVEAQFEDWLAWSFAKHQFEWGYAAVDKKIFVEELIGSDAPLMDFSVRSHNGQISFGTVYIHWKTPQYKYTFFYPDGSRCRLEGQSVPEGRELPEEFQVPASFFAAVEYAKILGAGFDYVRVDFLSNGKDLYFSEMTVYPASGLSVDGATEAIVFANWVEQIGHGWFFKQKHGLFMRLYQAALGRHFRDIAQATVAQAPVQK